MAIRLRIIPKNYIDSAFLSCSTEISTAPITNVQDRIRDNVFRSNNIVSTVIKGNLSKIEYASAFVNWRTNLTVQATQRLKFFDADNQTGNMSYDSGITNPILGKAITEIDIGIEPLGASAFEEGEPVFNADWFGLYVAKSFEFTVTDANNSDGYYESGRLYLGRPFEFSATFDLGHELKFDHNTFHERSDGGSVYTEQGSQFRVWEFQLNWISDIERAMLTKFLRTVGSGDELFIAGFPGAGGNLETDYSMTAVLVDDPKVKHHRNKKWFVSIEVMET